MAVNTKDVSVSNNNNTVVFDPTKIVTAPSGRAIAELYGVSDEQAAEIKANTAGKFVDQYIKQESGIDFERRLDITIDNQLRHVAQATQDDTSLSAHGTIVDEANKTKVEYTLGNTRADRAGGADFTIKLAIIAAIVIVVLILALK